MHEHENLVPIPPEQTPDRNSLTQSDLETLYIFTGDPRGAAALLENVEYDAVREVVPSERLRKLLEQVSPDKSPDPTPF